MIQNQNKLKTLFRKHFGEGPERFFWSPGRVNIIGEHTDYHGGWVMPAAINLGIIWAVKKNPEGLIRGYSEKFDEMGQFQITDKARTKFEWLLYLQGVTKILKKFGEKEGEVIFRRALHPILENERVKQMKKVLIEKDYSKIGKLLSESHQSLRDNYEVSCKELDIAVDIAHEFPELIGSRMVGGGFGGCTVNLVKKGYAQHFAGHIEEEFRKSTGIKGNAYICQPSDGVKEI